MIYQMHESAMAVEDLSEEQYALINNVLATLNLLGIYYEGGYVSRKDVLRFFALTVVRLMPAAETYLAHRDQLVGTVSWPELRALADDSAKFVRHRSAEPADVPDSVDG